jgi:hypothetical protein
VIFAFIPRVPETGPDDTGVPGLCERLGAVIDHTPAMIEKHRLVVTQMNLTSLSSKAPTMTVPGPRLQLPPQVFDTRPKTLVK